MTGINQVQCATTSDRFRFRARSFSSAPKRMVVKFATMKLPNRVKRRADRYKVLSTLHTNDAPARSRSRRHGIERFISSDHYDLSQRSLGA